MQVEVHFYDIICIISNSMPKMMGIEVGKAGIGIETES